MEDGTFVCSDLGASTAGCSGEFCFGMMYVEWYGDCNFVVISVVEICVDYGVCMCFMFVLICALCMVVVFVLMYVVYSVL